MSRGGEQGNRLERERALKGRLASALEHEQQAVRLTLEQPEPDLGIEPVILASEPAPLALHPRAHEVKVSLPPERHPCFGQGEADRVTGDARLALVPVNRVCETAHALVGIATIV